MGEWLTNIVISGALVTGALLVLLFTAMMFREAEESSLRARAPPPIDNSDQRRRPFVVGSPKPARPLSGKREDKSPGRGDGVIISGFDTGGSRLLVSVGGAAMKRRRAGVCFGRDPGISEFTIPDDSGSLSRRHFRIRMRDQGRFEIEDLGSVAGTKVDGAALRAFEPRPLNLPAKVEVGRTALDLRGGGEGDVVHDVQTALIGRHSDCEISIQDDSVSRFHAELVLGPGRRLFLVDRQSTRGTWLQKGGWQRLDRAEYVQEDQRVRFGNYETSIGEIARRLGRHRA